MPLSDAEDSPSSASRTVLLVEDEVLLRFAMADTLRGCGFTVIEAVSAEEAVALLESPAKIDLVFSDICLPGPMSGLDLAKMTRASHPEIGLMLTSGTAVPSAAELDCADGFFIKPYDTGYIIRRITKLLDRAIDYRA